MGVVLVTNHRVAALSDLALSHWLMIRRGKEKHIVLDTGTLFKIQLFNIKFTIISHYLLEFRVFELHLSDQSFFSLTRSYQEWGDGL